MEVEPFGLAIKQGENRTKRSHFRVPFYLGGTFSTKKLIKSMPFFGNGARGRNRTTDTAIFNRLLYP